MERHREGQTVEAFLGGATEWGRTLLVLTASRLVLLNKTVLPQTPGAYGQSPRCERRVVRKETFRGRVISRTGRKSSSSKVQARYAENFVNTLKAGLTARTDAENVLPQ